MAKARTTAFFCSECGYESSKWMGQCPACKAWNTMVEEPIAKSSPSGAASSLGAGRRSLAPAVKPALLSEIDLHEQDRISTGFKELDRVLGDGIVNGSLVLVGGDPASANPRCFCRCAAIWRARSTGCCTYRARSP